METLKGQKAVVTGGSRGLGLGIVEALVAQQARVTVVARDLERLARVSKRLCAGGGWGGGPDQRASPGAARRSLEAAGRRRGSWRRHRRKASPERLARRSTVGARAQRRRNSP